jgi:predicted porin
MQKKIIALAVAAAFSAPAFADVTVYGIVDTAIANVSKTGMKSDLTVLSGGLSTSRIGVVAVEDLDNGMKAIAKVEYKLNVVGADGTGVARQEMLAVAGGFGTVAAGYLQTTGYDWAGKFDPTAGSQVDAFSDVNPSYLGIIGASSRAATAAAYISPNMGGFSFAVNRSFNVLETGMVASNATTGNKTTANLLSVSYDAGPLAVGGVYAATADDDQAFVKNTQMALGASYDLGVAKLMGTYNTTKMDTTGTAGNADKMLSFSAVAPVGPGAVVFSYAKNTIDSTTAEDNTSAFTLAYLQGLSKTTTAYAAVEKISLKTATTVDTTKIAVGLRKKF